MSMIFNSFGSFAAHLVTVEADVKLACDAAVVKASKQRCGWLKDKFGLSWQIIPSILGALLHDKDPKKSKRVMDAMLQMDKIDIASLREAHAE